MEEASDNGDDDALMARLVGGEEHALNALMVRWERRLVKFALRYTGNRASAVDLAQETFVRIYQGRASYAPGGKFSTWMFTIAANLCRNHGRWRVRHPSVAQLSARNDGAAASAAIGAAAIDPGRTPDYSAMCEDDAAQVRAAVQALPHALRTAVLLAEFEDMSHREIAAVLGCSSKAVESRLYRARQILRERLRNLIS